MRRGPHTSRSRSRPASSPFSSPCSSADPLRQSLARPRRTHARGPSSQQRCPGTRTLGRPLSLDAGRTLLRTHAPLLVRGPPRGVCVGHLGVLPLAVREAPAWAAVVGSELVSSRLVSSRLVSGGTPRRVTREEGRRLIRCVVGRQEYMDCECVVRDRCWCCGTKS